MSFGPEDLSVVIPTRGRWPLLSACLDALWAQDVSGFEVVVVADGTDQEIDLGPHAGRVSLFTQDHAGPGVARNRGVAAAGGSLILLLGDDMLAEPGLVRAHLEAHNRRPTPEDAVLGLVEWHPHVASGRIQRWLDWSGTQFDFAPLADGAAGAGETGGGAGVDAGWWRLYSSNVSVKKDLFDRVGGFDPDFRFLYEDTDLGWRLSQAGMRLWFEADALTRHYHRYDWPGLRRRFETTARAERLMAAKHDWFEPWFQARVEEAMTTRPPSPIWPLVVDRLPDGPWRTRARNEANRWYFRQLGPSFRNAWESERDLEELREYLGDEFDLDRLHRHKEEVEAEQAACPTESDFYRRSQAYLYDLTAFASWDTKIPYRADIARFAPAGAHLLDYGCGIGSDGLRLIQAGYRVDFADFDNPSTRYLRWRLEHRGNTESQIFDLDRQVPSPPDGGRYHLAFALDVIEHVEDPFAFLGGLEAVAELVAVNLLEPDPDDTDLHHDLPITALLDYVTARELMHYRLYYGRSHLVIYRPAGRRRLRSRARMELGRRLSGPKAWRPGAIT